MLCGLGVNPNILAMSKSSIPWQFSRTTYRWFKSPGTRVLC